MDGSRVVVIGIAGVTRSGKDTIAEILCRHLDFTRVALADGVRSTFRDMDGPTWELTKGLESAGKTTRWALQQLGTEARIAAGAPALWVDLLATKIAYLSQIDPTRRSRFVVPDLRFALEADRIRKMFAASQIWGVSRPGSGLSGDAALHASERLVRDIEPDLKIFNGDSRSALEALVVRHAAKFLSRQGGSP